MFNRLSRWGLLLVAMLGFSLVLAACGDSPTPTTASGTNTPNQAAPVPAGLKSALAGSFPDSTAVYITLNTDTNSGQIKSWQKMVEYLTTIPDLKVIFQNTDVLALAKLGTYDGDIKPWIGSEIAIGLTDLNAILNLTGGTGAAPAEVPALIGAPVTDRTKAEAFVTKLADQLKTMGLPAPAKEAYKDATLWTFNLGIANVVAGLGKDKLFIGGGPVIVKAALDRTEAQSLASGSQYKAVTAKMPAGNLGFVYVDSQTIFKNLNNNPQTKDVMAGLKNSNLDYTGSIGMSFATADEGFRVDIYQTLRADLTPPAVAEALKKGNNPSKILSVMPETTFAFANQRDASSAYDLLLSTLKTSLSTSGSTSGADLDKSIADFEKESGLSVKNDIVSLFNGEYVIFATPDAANKEFPVGIGLVSEASDKAATQAKIDKITAAIEKSANGQMKWESKTTGNTTYKTATSAGTPVSLNIGVTGNYAFFSLGNVVTGELIGSANGGKNFTNGAGAANFNKVKAALPADNTGYFYADFQSIIKLASGFIPTEQSQSVKNVTDKLDKLYSIGTASRQNASESSTTVFIYFPVTK